jgi:hypothetical protein
MSSFSWFQRQLGIRLTLADRRSKEWTRDSGLGNATYPSKAGENVPRRLLVRAFPTGTVVESRHFSYPAVVVFLCNFFFSSRS